MTTNDTNAPASFHQSNYGDSAGSFRADLDGFVHLTPEAVVAGRWPGDFDLEDEQWAEETAEHNREAKQRADARLAEWRG